MSWFLFHFYYRCICALKMHVFQLSTKQNYTTLAYRILNREYRDTTHRLRCDCGVFKLSSVLCVWNLDITVTKELISYTLATVHGSFSFATIAISQRKTCSTLSSQMDDGANMRRNLWRNISGSDCSNSSEVSGIRVTICSKPWSGLCQIRPFLPIFL